MNKTFWGIAISLLALQSCGQSSEESEAIIRGSFDTPFTGTVYLGHMQGRFTNVDSVKLDGGSSYEFRISLDSTDCYRISTRPGYGSQDILTEKGGIYEATHTEEERYGKPYRAISVSAVKGEEQKRLNAYEKVLEPYGQEMEKLSEIYMKAKEAKQTATCDSVQKILMKLYKQQAKAAIDHIASCRGTYAALKMSSMLIGLDFPDWDRIYQQMDTVAYASDPMMQALRKNRNEAQAAWIEGQKAPLFTTTDLQGRKVSLAGFKSRYVLLDFWASWCAPCRAKAKELKKLYPQLQARGIEVCGINLDDKREAWAKATREDQIIWTNTANLSRFDQNEIADTYKVRQIPSLFLIDTESGVIAKQDPDEEYLLGLPEI